jgi:hypothetical protein
MEEPGKASSAPLTNRPVIGLICPLEPFGQPIGCFYGGQGLKALWGRLRAFYGQAQGEGGQAGGGIWPKGLIGVIREGKNRALGPASGGSGERF